MNKFLIFFLIFAISLFAENINTDKEKVIENPVSMEEYNPNVDCLVLQDENSIICKFEVIRDVINEQQIVINWISPTGEVSRTREMIIPAGDVSAYDYRYIDGRENGKWDFKIIYNGKEFISQFELK